MTCRYRNTVIYPDRYGRYQGGGAIYGYRPTTVVIDPYGRDINCRIVQDPAMGGKGRGVARRREPWPHCGNPTSAPPPLQQDYRPITTVIDPYGREVNCRIWTPPIGGPDRALSRPEPWPHCPPMAAPPYYPAPPPLNYPPPFAPMVPLSASSGYYSASPAVWSPDYPDAYGWRPWPW